MLNTFHKTVFERSFARLWARWQYILTTFDGERGRKPFCGGPCTRSSHLKAAPHPPARTEASTMSGAVRTPPSLAERSEEDKCRRLGRVREHAGSLNIGGGQGYTKVPWVRWVHRGAQGYIGVSLFAKLVSAFSGRYLHFFDWNPSDFWELCPSFLTQETRV